MDETVRSILIPVFFFLVSVDVVSLLAIGDASIKRPRKEKKKKKMFSLASFNVYRCAIINMNLFLCLSLEKKR